MICNVVESKAQKIEFDAVGSFRTLGLTLINTQTPLG